MSERSAMHDISLEHMRTGAARTPHQRGFVLFAFSEGQHPELGDVIVLRNRDGTLVPARFAGNRVHTSMPEEDELPVLVGVHISALAGVPLGEIADVDALEGDTAGHDWGAMGLPEGPNSRVESLADATWEIGVTVALASKGYQEFASDRRLSIGAGDEITVAGRPGTIVAVDRRKKTVEVRFGDRETPEVVDFEAIEALEQDQ